MILKTTFALVFFFLINSYSFSAGTTSNETKSYYDQATKLINAAKKYELKGKNKKAKKRYERALKFLIKENKKKPNQANTLNYLGFTSRKLGDYENGEKYYLLGLKIDPEHKGINEYLGELYVATDRINLAKKRLAVLKNCNCEEYKDLKEIIEGKKSSKY
jgi:tetratricopeptide (TPR) repeat protein